MHEIDGVYYADNPMEEKTVKSMRVLPDLILIVTFTTGESKLIDVTELKGSALEPLKNQKVLENFDLSRGWPSWNNGEIDISPDALYSFGYDYVPPTTLNQ